MRKDVILPVVSFLGLVFFSTCSGDSPSKTLDSDAAKKLIHIKEQWIAPPPDFETYLISYIEEYDRNGNRIEKKIFNQSGDHTSTIKAAYNDQDDEISKTATNHLNQVTQDYSNEISYNKKGEKEQIIFNSPSGILIRKITYNDDGTYKWEDFQNDQLVDWTTFDENDLPMEVSRNGGLIYQKMVYDEHDNPLKEYRKAKNNPEYAVDYENVYNEKGDLVKKTVVNKSYLYTYDEEGNVLTETWYTVDDKTREIEYKYKFYD